MSAESLNRTSDHNLETPSINLNVLKRKKENQKPKKKVCVNQLNHRLHVSQKKDKFRNSVIIFSIFLTIGVMGFIIT